MAKQVFLAGVLCVSFFQITGIDGKYTDANTMAHYFLDGEDSDVRLHDASIIDGRGPLTKAIHFNRTNSYATTPRISLHEKDFTIACWINLSFLNSNTFIYGEWLLNQWRFYLGIMANGTKFHFSRHGYEKAAWWTVKGGAIPFNTWTHVAVTWNLGKGIAKLYVDALQTQNRSFDPKMKFGRAVGDRYRIGNNVRWQFFGAIMDLYVLDVSLSRDDLEHLKDAPVAKIREGNVSIGVGQALILHCAVSGKPMLEVSWKKDGSTEIHKADIARPHNKTLVVKLVEIAEEGIYECEVRNTRGTATARSLVRVVPTSTTESPKSSAKWSIAWLILIALACCATLGFIGFLIRRRFSGGHSSVAGPIGEAPLSSLQTKRRFSDSWKIAEDDLYLQSFLGVGAFGEVWKAMLKLTDEIKPGNREVAVKTLKGNSTEDCKIKFRREMDLGKMLGAFEHPHIIQFIGCVNNGDNLMLIMEYTPHGDLLGFMRTSRGVEDKHHVGEGFVRELSNYDLVTFARQIANGMQFLNSKRIVHRDLAARNVLVTSTLVCKITDFGMAFHTENCGYEVASRGRLPIKWTAPEVLFDTSGFPVTSKSDVWSYGILLYEIFTLGGNPYDGLTAAEVIARLQNKGYRMQKPDHISDEIYNIMMSCWHEDPNSRPTFQELNRVFMEMIAAEHYMDVFDRPKYENDLYQPEKLISCDSPLPATPMQII